MAFTIGKNVSVKVETVKRLNNLAAVVHGPGRIFRREYTSEKKGKSTSVPLTKDENNIIKSVFVSQSNNIYTNLAIENWLYKNSDFNKHHALLIWRNSPCVVIGRHQNPWLESNMRFLAERGVEIARRNSGGGTVYHDKGNINLTFFTPRERYNRKYNLKVIKNALKREWGLDVEITEKDDLFLNNNKVSGTASKLGRPNAYHHCTLLVDANKSNLKESLAVNKEGFETNATQSVPSRIINLTDENSQISIGRLLSAIGWEYLRTTAISLNDGGEELISKQRGFQLINPTDQWFPGLNKIRDEFMSWDWRFGKTPKFSVTRTFRAACDSSEKVTDPADVTVTIRVEKGEITDVSYDLPESESEGVGACRELLTRLQGQKYSSQTFDLIEKSLSVVEEREKKVRALNA